MNSLNGWGEENCVIISLKVWIFLLIGMAYLSETLYFPQLKCLLKNLFSHYCLAFCSWRNDTNVILADEMGLGKTVQSVSMLGFLQVSIVTLIVSFEKYFGAKHNIRLTFFHFPFYRMLSRSTGHFLLLYHCPPCQTGQKNLGSGCLIWTLLYMLVPVQAERWASFPVHVNEVYRRADFFLVSLFGLLGF